MVLIMVYPGIQMQKTDNFYTVPGMFLAVLFCLGYPLKTCYLSLAFLYKTEYTVYGCWCKTVYWYRSVYQEFIVTPGTERILQYGIISGHRK